MKPVLLFLVLQLLFCLPGYAQFELPIDGKCREGLRMYFFDHDGDGYGNPNQPVCSSSKPSNAVLSNSDCNDNNPSIYPGAQEIDDGVDNDCDGQIDEGFGSINPIALSNESFESGLGGWLQDSSDNIDWVRNSGGTPSTGTGPNTGDDGAYYLHLEASGYTNKRGILKSPLYIIPSGTSMRFGYHMYGAAMGSLKVEISTNNGGSWSSVWTKSGDQGNQWHSASIDLSAYGGSDVMVRFNGLTGNSYTSDVGIDNLRFTSDTGGGAFPVLSNENYVFTRVYQEEFLSSGGSVTAGEILEEVMYYDGLGRPMQQVGIQQSRQSGNYKDLITPIMYDAFGRLSKDHLPYPSGGTSGSYRSGNLMPSLNSFYSGTFGEDFEGVVNPYSEKEFEASPLNRVKRQAAPGSDWHLGGGHEVEFAYQANASNEVRLYTVTFNGGDPSSPSLSGGSSYYAAGELYKTVTYNENNDNKELANSTEEFKDKLGRVVLTRTYNGTSAHDTFYVYDDYGNLTYVLSPKAEGQGGMPTTLELNELCYQYRYDDRNRLIEKKVPGKGWEYLVYNKLDQPVMTQDPIQRSKKEWLFTKYDAFGRVAYTGLYKSSTTKTRAYLQSLVENGSFSSEYVSRSSSNTYAGTVVYYNNSTIPGSIEEVYTINYYDNYTNLNIGFSIPSTNALGQSIVKGINTKGLATVSKARVLGTSHWITTAMGYDDKGRIIWSKTTNPYLGTTDFVSHEVDFRGRILQTQTRHQKGGKSDILITDTYTYDYLKRLEKHTQSINGGDEELIAANDYDELGQLKIKKVGNNSTSPLQEITYDYNVRGWLKQINDIGNTNKLFNFKISYNDPSSGTALYNGNISRTDWRTDNDDSNLKNYRYYYDDLNRLTSASANSYNYNVSNIGYDKNGNIQSLKRMGPTNSAATSFGNMDVLSYAYNTNSNKLRRVNDSGSNNYGFKDGSSASTQYAYDLNGNLTSDLNKGILTGGIKYNHLDLPTEVKFNNSSSQVIKYTYDATGVKLRKEIPGKTTDYAGGFIYEKLGTGNTELQFFNHPEGYVSYDNGQFNYVYNYVDHLGNVRLSYTDGNGDGSIDPATEIIQEKNYYPFGLEHKGYNSTIIGTENNYMTYQGKELQKELDLNWHDFGARQYDPAIGRWISPDPLSEEFSSWSPYNAMSDNPINFVDPTGMAAEWIPKINEDGSASYIAEDGDSAATLSSQYGISQNDAEAITGTTGDTEIAEGTEISGETVNNVTGSEVLKLDLNSKEGRSSQRRFDQFLFARDHSSSKGAWAFLSTDYYSNTDFKEVIQGMATMTAGGSSFQVHYEIPMYRAGTFDGSGTGVGISNYPITSKQTSGQTFSGGQENISLPIYHPNSGNQMGNYELRVHTSNSNRVFGRLNKKPSLYNYIRIPRKKID